MSIADAPVQAARDAVVLSDLFPLAELDAALAGGYVRRSTSADGLLHVLNYTEKAQYESVWNDVTRNCRGLVVSATSGHVLARGFPKFFNLHDHGAGNHHRLPPLPAESPVDISEKVDGSLGILVNDGEKWRIVTRGSADSDQAQYATQCLMDPLWADGWRPADRITYLFEIVYPRNRIVVDYGDYEGLVFLAALDNATGWDVDVPAPLVRHAERHPVDVPIKQLAELIDPEQEGYVVRWADGTRVKVKGAEYLRLHAIVTMCSTKTIWEHLATGLPLDELLDRVPDEFAQWLNRTVSELSEAHAQLTEAAVTAHDALCAQLWPQGVPDAIDRDERKAYAAMAIKDPNRAALFQLLDGKCIANWAWQQVKPEYARPFADEV